MNGKRFETLILICLALLLCFTASSSFCEVEKLVLIEKPNPTPEPGSKDAEIERLRQENARLKEKVGSLNQRVSGLESQQQASAAAASPTSPPISAWRQLKEEMPKSDVKNLLGPPGEVVKHEYNEYWYYPDQAGGMVQFGDQGAVLGWKEP